MSPHAQPAGPHAPAASAEPHEAGTQALRQFVTFHVDRETYAVPLAEVQEIIRLPEMVDVPLAPASLAGLANLRGAVLPVTSLRRLFSLPDRPHDDATRVVVISQGTPLGFVVDRMASVVTSDAAEIEGTEGLRATIDTSMLSGMIKRAGSMIMIIDPARLLQRGGPAAGRRADRAEGSVLDVPGAAGTAPVSDEIQLVSFELAGQEYALPIADVQEIVQVPDQISAVPNAEPQVIGVITLRDRLLPLVSLRMLFGLAEAPLSDQSRIVVVSWEADGQPRSVGIVTDTVKEVLRVARAIVDPLPDLFSGSGALREVEAICRIDQGRRLVSILSAERLFDTATLPDGAGALTGDTTMTQDERTLDARTAEEEQFVVFRLAEEEYGVPIEAVQEIVRVPEQLTRVPRTPRFIEGVVNLRGSVLPVVDQRRRFALPETERSDRQRIMVFLIDGVRTGFIVDSVSEVLKIPRAVIAPAPDLAQDEGSAVDRIANIAEKNRIILMLNVGRLLNRREVADLRQAA
ncbi:chemotaxis protein CheW [Methylobacterium sp. ID0610]|uniref:chemotaxis protein CheW n=1 Tax=Methylobacterium carpenticola TaxID=3344827 RepID=UPI0036B1DFBF